MQLAQFRQLSNTMCGWLPTNKMRSYITGVSGCPGYRYQIETLDHVLKCPNKEAKEARKAALTAFRMKGKKKRIPRKVIDRIHHLLTHYRQGHKGGIATSEDCALDMATNQQKVIGPELLPRGLLARDWMDATEEGGTEQLEQKMKHLQQILWSIVMVPLRKKRCNIQHGKDNQAKEANAIRLGDHIQWYVGNRHNVSSAYDI